MPVDKIRNPTLSRLAYRVRSWAMGNSPALLILGLGILGRGLSYLPGVFGDAPSRGSHPAEAMLTMTWWGAVWAFVGILCLVAAWCDHRGLEAASVGAGVGLNVLWAFSFMLATVTGDMPRGWVTSIGYMSVSLLALWAVWRGSRKEQEDLREAIQRVR